MALPAGEPVTMGAILADSATWVAVSFVIFVVLVVWKAGPGILKGLDKRGIEIRSQLDEARQLREEAEKQLAEYQRKHAQAMDEAKEIVASAKREAASIQEKSEANLQALLARREQSALDKLAQAEANATQEVKAQAVAYAIESTNQIMAKKVTAKSDAALVDDAIGQVTARLQ